MMRFIRNLWGGKKRPSEQPAAGRVGHEEVVAAAGAGVGPTQPEAPQDKVAAGEVLRLPMEEVLANWPEAWRGRPGSKLSEGELCVPVERVAAQLRSGRIVLSAEEAQRGCSGRLKLPADVKEVPLPLPVVLSRLGRERWRRRASQEPVRNPEEIPSLFGSCGQRLATEVEQTALAEELEGATAALEHKEIPKPVEPVQGRRLEQPAAAPTTASEGKTEAGTVEIPLQEVVGGWPELVRRCLAGGEDRLLELPRNRAEAGLKVGKLIFRFGEVASWMRPAARVAEMDEVREVEVSLPLASVVPRFMARVGKPAPQRKVDVGAEIPSLFQGGKGNGPASEERPVAEPGPGRADFERPEETAVAPVESGAAGAGEGRNPHEVVRLIGKLPQVSGAVIVTDDGLLVAGQVTAPVRGEDLSAFIPQLVGKVGECAKAMGLKEPGAVTVQMELRVLHVRTLPRAFMAVWGEGGADLPLDEIGRLADQLKTHP